jgi:xanthine dehydrogenase accessory factor
VDGWQIMEHADELARRGESFALATVVWRQGPSSSQLGSRAIITLSGELHGWIGGACAEPSVIRAAGQVIAAGRPRLLLLGTPEQIAATPRLASTHSGTTEPRAGEFGTGEFGAGDSGQDSVMVVPISCQSEGAMEVYIEPVEPAPHLVVVGRSPMAHTLADLARVLGWRADLYDWPDFRAAGATARSMVVVATQGHGDEEAVEQAVAAMPAYLGLVGSRRRGEAVLGYLADRGVPEDQLDRVQVPAGLDLGHTSHAEISVAVLAELVRLRASGELGDGGAAPRAGRSRAGNAAGRSAAGRRDHGSKPAAPSGSAAPAPAAAPSAPGAATAPAAPSTPSAPSTPAARPGAPRSAESVDPVCGMVVAVGPGARSFSNGGATYYFCSAGCRAQFETNPAEYSPKETRC